MRIRLGVPLIDNAEILFAFFRAIAAKKISLGRCIVADCDDGGSVELANQCKMAWSQISLSGSLAAWGIYLSKRAERRTTAFKRYSLLSSAQWKALASERVNE